jgi:DNA-binding transcriptional regulator YiaG
MTSPEIPYTSVSTSAAGAMRVREEREPVLVGGMLAGLGTSTTSALPQSSARQGPRSAGQTTAGAVVPHAEPPGGAIRELRRLSGLTWDQLAHVFSVSRRSLHFWASGKAMASRNEQHLQRVLAVVRQIDRGTASATRTVLVGARDDGTIPFDLLVAGDHERVVALVGPGEARRSSRPTISNAARAARAPRPPEEGAEALHDRIHPASGRLLGAKPITTTRGK